jgi:hypothetical protein
MAKRPEVHHEVRESLLALADRGGIDPLIAGTWGFDDAPGALEALADGALVGKALVVDR